MRLDQVMSSPVVTVPGTTLLADCAVLMAERHLRHLPVVDAQGRCTGLVTDYEIQHRGSMETPKVWVPRDASDATLTAAMVQRTIEVERPASAPLHEVLIDLAESSQDLALALDADHRPEGILTEHDVVRLVSDLWDGDGGSASEEWLRTSELPLLDAEMQALEARSWMARRRERHALVIRRGLLVGVLSLRDVALEEHVHPHLTASDVANRPVCVGTVPDPVRAARMLHDRKIGVLPVVDPERRPIAMVSRRDLAHALAARLASRG